jgi:Zn-dependent protease
MTGFRLGSIFGIEVHVHGSWLFIAGLVMWSLAAGALPADFPDVGGGVRLLMAAVLTLLFFVSLLGHELAHSVVAQSRGIPVHRITFFLFGGMAQTSTDSRSPGEEFLIAIAGPVMSFLLAGLFFFLWFTGAEAGWSPILVQGAAYLVVLNLVLGVFNLLPGFPMDGGRVLRAVIWRTTGDVTRATRWAARVGTGMAYLLMGYGFWQVLTGDTIGGVWLVFIAWFIRHAARTSYRQHLIAKMQQVARQTFESRYHRSPFGARSPWPGGPAGHGGAGEARGSPPASGRDVTGIGGAGT